MQRNEWAGLQDEWFQKLADGGMKIHEVDQQPFREALSSLQDSFAEESNASDLLARIREAGEE